MPRFWRWWAGAHDRRWALPVSALADAELEPSEAARVREHVEQCATCSARVARYRGLDQRMQGLTGGVGVPAAYSIFESVEGDRAPVARPRVGARLLLSASAIAIVLVVAVSPAVRAGVGNALQYVHHTAGSTSAESFAGERGIFRAARGSVLASTVHEFSLFATDASGQQARSLLDMPVSRGPIYVLRGDRVLFQPAGGAGWLVAGPDHAVSLFPIPPGMQVADVTPAGDRILLRTPDGHGGYTTGTRASQVISDTGSILWIDSIGADVYSLSPDGKYALSGEPNFLRRIPLDGSAAPPPIPFTGYVVERPQFSRDGGRAVVVANKEGGAPERRLRTATFDPFGVPAFSDPLPVADPPVFALSPDGRYLAVQEVESGGARTLTLWTLSGVKATPNQLPAFNGATIQRLTWSPDGRSLLVDLEREGRGEALVVTPTGAISSVMQTADVGSATWLPDGSGVVLVSDGGDPNGIVALNSSGDETDSTRLLAGSDAGLAPLLASNSQTVAYLPSAGQSQAPRLLARSGLQPAAVPSAVDGWSWASDGKRAVVYRDGQVYQWDARQGMHPEPLAAGTAASWSPNADRIVVLAASGNVSVIDPAGRLIASAPQTVVGAVMRWSPLGDSLAGVVHASGGDQLVSWQPASDTVTTLTMGGRIGSLAWAPDGKSIAYLQAAAATDTASLRIVRPGDASATILASVPVISASIAWQGDGSRLLYIDQPAFGAPGRVHSVLPDGTANRVLGSFFATALYPGPR